MTMPPPGKTSTRTFSKGTPEPKISAHMAKGSSTENSTAPSVSLSTG